MDTAEETELLALSVTKAIVSLAITGLPGFWAGYKRMIDQEFLQRLSKLVLNFFTPGMIVSALGARLSLERLHAVWPLLAWSCMQLFAGAVVSSLLLRSTRAWSVQLPDILASMLRLTLVFQSIAAWNLPLLQTLCHQEGLFPKHEPSHCYGDGLLMAFGYHMPWDLAMWTWGYGSMQLAVGQGPIKHKASSPSLTDENEEETAAAEEDDSLCTDLPRKQKSGVLDALQRLAIPLDSVLFVGKKCVNPILAAMACGLIIGLTPPLKEAIFGQGAVLAPLGVALTRIGAPVPMLQLQILTGTLGITLRKYREAAPTRAAAASAESQRSASEGQSSSKKGQRAVWLAMVLAGKLLVVPALGFLLFTSLDVLQSLGTDSKMSSLGQVEGVGSKISSFGQVEGDASPSSPLLGAQSQSLTPSLLVALSEVIWPHDHLMRTVIVMMWCAPSCLSMVILAHRVGAEEGIVHTVSMLYLVMYPVAAMTSTVWITAGLLLF